MSTPNNIDRPAFEAGLRKLSDAVSRLEDAVTGADDGDMEHSLDGDPEIRAAIRDVIVAVRALRQMAAPLIQSVDAEVEDVGRNIVGGLSGEDLANVGRQLLERLGRGRE